MYPSFVEASELNALKAGLKAITGFDGEKVEISCVFTGKTFHKPASSLVTVTAREPDDELYRLLISDSDALVENGIKRVDRIGDCQAPGIIAAAIHAGHRVAREMDAPEPGDVPFRRERALV